MVEVQDLPFSKVKLIPGQKSDPLLQRECLKVSGTICPVKM